MRSMSSGQTSLEPSLRSFLCLRCGVRDLEGVSREAGIVGRGMERGDRGGGGVLYTGAMAKAKDPEWHE